MNHDIINVWDNLPSEKYFDIFLQIFFEESCFTKICFTKICFRTGMEKLTGHIGFQSKEQWSSGSAGENFENKIINIKNSN